MEVLKGVIDTMLTYNFVPETSGKPEPSIDSPFIDQSIDKRLPSTKTSELKSQADSHADSHAENETTTESENHENEDEAVGELEDKPSTDTTLESANNTNVTSTNMSGGVRSGKRRARKLSIKKRCKSGKDLVTALVPA